MIRAILSALFPARANLEAAVDHWIGVANRENERRLSLERKLARRDRGVAHLRELVHRIRLDRHRVRMALGEERAGQARYVEGLEAFHKIEHDRTDRELRTARAEIDRIRDAREPRETEIVEAAREAGFKTAIALLRKSGSPNADRFERWLDNGGKP